MKLLVKDLRRRVVEAVGIDRTRYPYVWAKWIDAVDREQKDGYDFVGNFIDDRGEGEIEEIELVCPRLVLVAASTGENTFRISRKQWKTIYEYHAVVVLWPDGRIEQTGLETLETKRWALALRDQVELLLRRIESEMAGYEALTLAWLHLSQRGPEGTPAVRAGETVT